MKCDEGKPHCERCLKFGVKCLGYDEGPKPKPIRQLLPRNTRSPSPKQDFGGEASGHTLFSEPSINLPYENDLEREYFRHFQTCTALKLSGPFETLLWNRLVLQSCHDEAFVRAAVLALSAQSNVRNHRQYSFSEHGIGLQNLSEEQLIAVESQHNEFALRQYEKSIRIMRTTLANDPTNPRRAFLACLLVCCFEALSGRRFIALSHAKSGYKLLRDWLATYSSSFAQMSCTKTPAPQVIEDELVQALARLDLQTLTFFDSRTEAEHQEMMEEGAEALEAMPEVFPTINEARINFEQLQRRALHFIRMVTRSRSKREEINQTNISGDDPVLRSFTVTTVAVPEIDVRGKSYKVHPYESKQHQCGEELARWRLAFDPLYERIRLSGDSRQRVAANILAVNCTATELWLGACYYEDNSSYDVHLEEYAEIVALSRLIQSEARNIPRYTDSVFTFDLGIIPGLHLAGKWCRDRKIRRDALELLRNVTCREGVWDHGIAVELDTRLMFMEEEGVESEEIPESARVSLASMTVDVAARAIDLQIIRGANGFRENLTPIKTEQGPLGWYRPTCK